MSVSNRDGRPSWNEVKENIIRVVRRPSNVRNAEAKHGYGGRGEQRAPPAELKSFV